LRRRSISKTFARPRNSWPSSSRGRRSSTIRATLFFPPRGRTPVRANRRGDRAAGKERSRHGRQDQRFPADHRLPKYPDPRLRRGGRSGGVGYCGGGPADSSRRGGGLAGRGFCDIAAGLVSTLGPRGLLCGCRLLKRPALALPGFQQCANSLHREILGLVVPRAISC